MQYSKWITLGFGALCLIAVATVLRAQHLYYMAALLLTLPGVSYLLGWQALRGLEFSRELPQVAWEGEEGAVRYRVRNRTRLTRFFLSIHEPLPDWILPADAEPPLFNVAGDEETTVSHPVVFRKRGVYQVRAFDVTAMDPLGVFAFTKHVPCEGELVVYPLPRPISSMELTGADRYGWQEFMAPVLRGSSVDFDGVRPYTEGDPLRRIHWRQTARTGKLSVIEFEESQAVNLVIVLDTQRGTDVGAGLDTTLEYAVRFAASVSQEAIRQGASVRLVVSPGADEEQDSVGHLVTNMPAGRGQDHLFAILNILARVEANSPQPISTTVERQVGALPPGTTLLILTSQADSALPAVLMRYTGTGANVGVAYIDPDTFRSGRGRMIDAVHTDFVTRLMGARAHAFILRCNPGGDLHPETIKNVTAETPAFIQA